MKTVLFIIIMIVLCSPAFAGSSKAYTDDDLENYSKENRIPSSPDTVAAPHSSDIPKVGASEKDQAEQWCQRATQAKDRITKAKKTLYDSASTEVDTRRTYGRRYIGSTAVATTSIETDRARNELRDAEDDYKRIVEEADRKGIPPGWLYCNY